MTRADGKFPEYEKIDIDPDFWPSDYWTESMVCEVCDINWPCTLHFSVCPMCHTETKEADFRPTYRYPEAVKRLLTARFDDLYQEWDEGTTDEDILEEVNNVEESRA